jgi:uncharacterized protein YhbP (UPF0306 family)
MKDHKTFNMEAIALEIKMDANIIEFLKKQTVMTLATCKSNVPHCAMCFYVYDEEHKFIVFKSKPTTEHVQQALANNKVSGSILPDKFIPAKTSGIQFYGTFYKDDKNKHAFAAHHYYRKYPFAAAMPGELWIIELDKIVFTDATLGFGKKREWVRSEPEMVEHPV